jgi:aryl-alcohol dehydrogenase-like predicted oxidoreductase
MRLGLGTAQFGLDYGISNHAGRTSPAEVAKVLEVARAHQLGVIDTAALYGASEAVLGQTLPADHGFRIVTKTIRFGAGRIAPEAADQLEVAFRASLEKLRARSVYGLLVHHAPDLLTEGGALLWERLVALKREGCVARIGASVYGADELELLLRHYPLDLVQLPVNVLDQRLLAGSQLAELKARGVEVHARSAFLQGLLLMAPEELPAVFDSARPHLGAYHAFLRQQGLSPVRAALGFLATLPHIDVVVCGVNDHRQLEELCRAAEPLPGVDFSRFALDDDTLLNPSKWRRS